MRAALFLCLLFGCRGNGAESIGFFCEDDGDCGGGDCVEYMCTISCDGEDFDLESCPEKSLCHEGTCQKICWDLNAEDTSRPGDPTPPPDCPYESVPDHADVGYQCAGPHGDYSGDYYTCAVVLGDPGG